MSAPTADFRSHHITGFAHAAQEAGEDGLFDVPLLSQIEDNLWTGGCIGGVSLGDEFEYVVSLYPWEKYSIGPNTERVEVRLYDANEVPDRDQLYSLAWMVNQQRANGRTLVHCQAGLNRSGLVTALALMLAGRTADEAITLLREKRCPMVLCNRTFEGWLREQVINR